VRLVTVSAAYGAGGSVVAPRLADRLGLPFADRLIPASNAPTPGPGSERVSEEERRQKSRSTFLTRLAYTTGAVILGRAAAVVLAGHPRAFHVRLDGPLDRRAARAMGIEGVDERTAWSRLEETDRARTQYVERLYGRDPADPRLYHLILDSTVLSVDGTVEVVTSAAAAFWEYGKLP
jgi:cytidylate kinase